MSSPLFNAFGNAGANNTPFGNMNDLLQRFGQFKQTFNGNPRAQVQQLLNTGRMTQEQFTQLKQMAEQMQRLLK